MSIKKALIDTALPTYSLRRRIVKRVLVKLHLKSPYIAGFYNTWMNQQIEHPPLREQLRTDVDSGPLISIVVPAYNTPSRYLTPLIYSIVSQAYKNWELILVNASNNEQASDLINRQVDVDTRIRVINLPNKSIAQNTNGGIKEAKGAYVAFVDHDDVLDPFALYECVLRILDEGAELIYTDEDKLSDNGEVYYDPHFKPAWSPDLLTHVNYINHLSVIKKELIEKVGMLNPKKDGAQDYDLVLRIIDTEPVIAHVPKVLYHWRAAQNSTAQDFSSKRYVTDAGRDALKEHFDRLDTDIEVTPKANRPGFYALNFALPEDISVIVSPFASDALLHLYIEMLLKRTELSKLKIKLIVPDGAQPHFKTDNVTVESVVSSTKYMREALSKATGEYAVIINQIAFPLNDPKWLQALCGPLQLKHVAAAAPIIVRGTNVIDDCGMVLSSSNDLIPLFKGQGLLNNQTFFGNTDWTRNVDALSGGITAVRSKELKQFLDDRLLDGATLIKEYSQHSKQNGKFNMIYSEVVLNNCAINLAPKVRAEHTFFAPQLFADSKDYVPYTAQAAAIYVLERMDMDEAN